MSKEKMIDGPWSAHFDSEFLRGQQACKDGEPHTDQSEGFNRGYAAQYQHEQNMDALTRGKHGHKKAI